MLLVWGVYAGTSPSYHPSSCEVLDMSDNTKKAVLLRVSKTPSFEVVPQHAISLFDKVMSESEADALRLHPNDEWARIAYFKREILRCVAPSLRGMIAGQFHEYVATLRRNDSNDDGFDYVPSYGGEARAQRDAYLACCASLD